FPERSMLKRLFAAFTCLAFAGPAAASPDLAAEWGHAATGLYADTVHAIEGGDLPANFEDSLTRFSVNAARLGSWIDKSGGPVDLGCIFRGMSEEAEIQLYAITSQSTRETALRRLATLFYDAETISLAAIHAGGSAHETRKVGGPPTCVGSPALTLQYLTEQP
ncbi:MAG: hypothetical protein AAF638_06245, partial [Pseudomonadota bacterium]